jgi:hypothetical protein
VRQELDSTDETGKKLELYRRLVAESSTPAAHRQQPGLDAELAAIIDRCLEVDARRRYPGARAVQDALERRELRLRQRPWLAFALVAPLLLLLAIGAAGRMSALNAVDRARQQQVEQLIQSDMATARLLAEAVDQRLLTFQQFVEAALTREDPTTGEPTHLWIARALAEKDRKGLRALAGRLYRENKSNFFQWSIFDARGVRRATFGEGTSQAEVEELIDDESKLFAYRGWFNGGVDRYGEESKSFPPLTAPHISHPYYGQTCERGVVCFSSPIKDEGGAVVGVLCAPVTVEKLAEWVKKGNMAAGYVVLADNRGFCVYHPDPEDPQKPVEPKPNQLPKRIDWAPLEQLRASTAPGEGPELPAGDGSYIDPINNQPYLAAMKILPRSQWTAIVQHELTAVDRPVQELQWKLAQGGVTILGTSLALVLGLWGCLYTWLRREGQAVHV